VSATLPAGAIGLDALKALVDFEATHERVRARLARLSDARSLLDFMRDYGSWNGCFANGVSALASLIGSQRQHFAEAGFPRAVADRSNFVASYFFEAARDEYDDHINPARDTHRCMAQAGLLRLCEFFALPDQLLDVEDGAALQALNEAVLQNYTGQPLSAQGALARAFFGIGYHLGSELLADGEFSLIDETLRRDWPELVHSLMRSTVTLAGGEHRCYAWVGVHSGHGGGVEADHFDRALEGLSMALRFLQPADFAPQARAALAAGFRAFEADHLRFFDGL
jgi:hypothetical protein